MKVLFVASEAFPLMKTGGLGDVCGSLPPALAALGVHVRLLMPAYRDTLAVAGSLKTIARLRLPPDGAEATLLEGVLPGTDMPVWLLDHPPSFDRPGNPYTSSDGHGWPDNAERFARLNRAAVLIALGRAQTAWRPDVVHAHDWQAGLVSALLRNEPQRPATVFTIHNLAYQGVFPYHTFISLGLPKELWAYDALEFHGQFSFIKGGLAFADRITTVSPTYAREIRTPAFGEGLDGLLRHRSHVLSGILNGIDERHWDPAHDQHLDSRYAATRWPDKLPNKLALQQELQLPARAEIPLASWVGRLVAQKGVDLLLEALPALMAEPLQLVVLGSGEARYERWLRDAADQYPGRVALLIGYDEVLAHRIFAGSDLFLMPSRFEPCGLSQLYALRYGAVPVVHGVGGLADTVRDAAVNASHNNAASGIVFNNASGAAFAAACRRALTLYHDEQRWAQLAINGMRQDFSWRHSAGEYRALYDQLLSEQRRKLV
jgi:starch synthase